MLRTRSICLPSYTLKFLKQKICTFTKNPLYNECAAQCVRGYFSGALTFSRELTLIRPWSSLFGAHLYLRYTEILIHPRLARYTILIDEIKNSLRIEQRNQRKQLAKQHPNAAKKIARFATNIIQLSAQKSPTIALYNAIGSELNLRYLHDELLKLNCQTALPVVIKPASPLIFREYQPNTIMTKDLAGILSPTQKHPTLTPDIILLPLLGFDDKGGRLGYGGGFYDRTLAALNPNIISIGVGYAEQKMQKTPMGLHDKPVDYILTEKQLMKIYNY